MEIAQNYKETITKALDENSASTKAHYAMCSTIAESLTTVLQKDDLAETERVHIAYKLIILAQMVYAKDSENKQFIIKIALTAGSIALGLATIAASLLRADSSISAPSDNDASLLNDDESDDEIIVM